MEGIQIGNERLKFSLFSDNMILTIENPKIAIQKPGRIKKFNKVSAFKISIQKSVAFLYTDNDLSEKQGNNCIYNRIKNT